MEKQTKPTKLQQYDSRLGLFAFAAQMERWREAAFAQHMTLSDWVRRTLDAAVGMR
jgi:hypothetical protein